ncbi:MAG: hypothetical protein H6741_02245 [Alphaproteobacteria bacterium]|nr:hypothetical protein [Alphaproteobacteria bacterium]MCB9791524.1 hypothetical protein [Alphaproteobacteria bacterium]
MPESVDPAALNQLVADISPIGVIPPGGTLTSGDWNLLVRAVVGLAEQLGAEGVSWSDVARSSRTVEEVASAPEPSPSTTSTTSSADPTLRAEFERLRSAVNTRTEATRLALEGVNGRLGALEGGSSSSSASSTAALERVSGSVTELVAGQKALSSQLGGLSEASVLAAQERVEARLQALEAANANQDASLSRLTVQVERLNATLEGLASGGSDVSRELLSELRASVDANTTQVTSLRNQLTAVDRALRELDARLDTLEGDTTTKFSFVDTRFVDLSEALATGIRPIDSIKDRLGAAERGIGAVEADIDSRFTNVGRVIQATQGEVGGLKTRIGSAETSLGGLQTWKTSAAKGLTDLETAQAATRTDLSRDLGALQASVTRDLGALNTSLGAVNTKVGAAETNISGLTRSLSGVSTQVSSLNTSVGSLSTSYSTLNTKVTGLDSSVGSLSSSYSSLNTKVTTLNSSVSSLSSSYSSLSSRVTSLDSSLVSFAEAASTSTSGVDYSAMLSASNISGVTR